MVNPRSILFGSKIRVVVAVLVLLVATVGGAFAAGVLGAPSVAGVQNRFGDVTETTTAIETNLTVNNPNPIGVRLGGTSVNYTVSMNDVQMASGSKDGIAVDRGNTSLHFSTRMRNERIPAWWVSHIRNGEHTELRIDARVHSSLVGQSVSVPYTRDLNTDIISQFNSTETRPVNADQPVVSDPILYVNRTSASWGSVTDAETPIAMQFVVYNPKTTPYTITELGYHITMNNVSVGNGTTEDPYVIPGRSTKTIAATTAIQNQKLDEWWVSHLRRNQVTRLRIDFYARVELPTGNTVRVPLDELTYTKRIETDFFGNKRADGTDGGSSNDAGGTDTATRTAADESSTSTATSETATSETATSETATSETASETTTTTATTTSNGATTTATTTDDGILDLRRTGEK